MWVCDNGKWIDGQCRKYNRFHVWVVYFNFWMMSGAVDSYSCILILNFYMLQVIRYIYFKQSMHLTILIILPWQFSIDTMYTLYISLKLTGKQLVLVAYSTNTVLKTNFIITNKQDASKHNIIKQNNQVKDMKLSMTWIQFK